jgi:hypothetical protein
VAHFAAWGLQLGALQSGSPIETIKKVFNPVSKNAIND